LRELLDPSGASHVAALFLHLLVPTEREPRAAPRLVRAHSGALVFRGFVLEVQAQFIIELGFHGVSPKKGAQPVHQIA
jgi:hypothetical protein